MSPLNLKSLDFADTAVKLNELYSTSDFLPPLSIPQGGEFLNAVMAMLFPVRSSKCQLTTTEIQTSLNELANHLANILNLAPSAQPALCLEQARQFIAALPRIGQELRGDAATLCRDDPAARSEAEIVLAYPGFYAIFAHRVAHYFYQLGIPLFPRILSAYAHRMTGVDIHPGAKIGQRFFLDHATGVVIGETAVIGNNVKIYQGVTLGSLRLKKESSGAKRHPTIEDNVVIYANATILGGQTIIGHDSIIGGNVWLTKSVLAFSRVMYQASNNAENSLDWNI